MTTPWPILLVLFITFRLASSLVNITIDDYYGDPVTGAQVVYNPDTSAWNFGPGCTDCTARPDPLHASSGTWHGGTFNSARAGSTDEPNAPPLASVNFSGSAVYVYCILSLSDKPAGHSDMTFFIDSQQVGEYRDSAPGVNAFAYDVLVYSNDSLPMGEHTITIQNGRLNGEKTLMILDYIVYSTDTQTLLGPPNAATSDPASANRSSKNKVLIGVLVTICLLFATVLAYLLYRLFITRRRLPMRISKTEGEILPTSKRPRGQFFKRKWFTRYFADRRSISFNASLLVANSHKMRTESTRDMPSPQPPISPEHPSQALLAPDEPGVQQKTESRWASIMSWRDRTVREAEIPSLAPTSNAPTTVFSGPTVSKPVPPQHQRPQHQETPGTPRTQPHRKFTVMNV